MESYTTISVRPETKKKIKQLKAGDETYSEYLDDKVEQEWEEREEKEEEE